VAMIRLMPLRSMLDKVTLSSVAYEASCARWLTFKGPTMGSRPALSRLVLTIQRDFRRTVTSGTTAPHCLVTKRFNVDPGKDANAGVCISAFAPTRDAREASPAFRPQDVLLFDALRRADSDKQLNQPVMNAFHQQLQRAATNATHGQLRCSRTAAGCRPSGSMLALAPLAANSTRFAILQASWAASVGEASNKQHSTQAGLARCAAAAA
jgi:hypothetical protein